MKKLYGKSYILQGSNNFEVFLHSSHIKPQDIIKNKKREKKKLDKAKTENITEDV